MIAREGERETERGRGAWAFRSGKQRCISPEEKPFSRLAPLVYPGSFIISIARSLRLVYDVPDEPVRRIDGSARQWRGEFGDFERGNLQTCSLRFRDFRLARPETKWGFLARARDAALTLLLFEETRCDEYLEG